MQKKSRRAIAASALALAVAGGAVAVITMAAPASSVIASASLPSPDGPAVTAAVPGRGSGVARSGSAGPAGQPADATGQPLTAAAGGTDAPGNRARTGAASQGSPGPLAAAPQPADGAVPGASPALRAMAAARQSLTVLPHSPRLLAELRGMTGSGPARRPAAATAGGLTLPGLDVAGYQHPVTKAYPHGAPIGWSSVAAAGYKFVAIKATEGDYYVNPWAATDMAAAKAAGLSVAPYHFAIPNGSSGSAQAQYTLEHSGYQPGPAMLPVMLDIEYDPYVSSDHTNVCYGLTPSAMTAWVGAFVSTVKSVTGLYPVIYTTANWWNTCTGSAAFGADPMWVAAYGFTSPPMPAGWTAWTMWQYTSGGTVPGVATPGTTDLDIFNPALVGLINPGSQAARTRARVLVPVRSLGALAGEALSWSASGLPPGLSLSASGIIAGTVSASAAPFGPRVYHVTISARNSAGAAERAAFAWQVTPTCTRHPTAGTCPGR